MTNTSRTEADTGLPDPTHGTKPSLVSMGDDLDRLEKLAAAMRWACAGYEAEELAVLADVVLAEIEAFGQKFEAFRKWPAEVAA